MVEKLLVKGCRSVQTASYRMCGSGEHTIRVSNGLRLRAVRGVLPRSFPGVLKISVTLLQQIVSHRLDLEVLLAHI